MKSVAGKNTKYINLNTFTLLAIRIHIFKIYFMCPYTMRFPDATKIFMKPHGYKLTCIYLFFKFASSAAFYI